MQNRLLKECGGRAVGARTGRATWVLIAVAGLIGAVLWWAISWTRTGASDRSPAATSAAAPYGLEGVSAGSGEPNGLVQDLAPVGTARTRASGADSPSTVTESSPTGLRTEDRANPATRVALAGQVDLYVDGQLTQSRLNGSIEVKTGPGPGAVVKLAQGHFEVLLHRQPSGDYATVDGQVNVGPDPEKARFQLAAPRADGVGPLLHYYLKTGAPRRGIEAIPFGTMDAVVTVTEAPALELDVLESGTNVHLDRVRAVAITYQGKMRLAWFEASPLRLIPGEPLSHSTAAVLAVSAPGYGTKEITVDFTRSHRRVVELSPAGRLVVHVEGEVPTGAKLFLDARNLRVDPAPCQSGDTRFDALVPGAYHARIQVVSTRGAPSTMLISGRVEVRANETAELTLVVPSMGSVTRADLAGVLLLPPEWSLKDRKISGRFLGQARSQDSQAFALGHSDLVPITGRAGVYSFEKKALEVGRYALKLDALGVQTVADLPPEGVRDIELVVGPPVNITVVTEDASSNPALATRVDTLLWGPKALDPALGRSMKTAHRDARSGKFHLVVPAGEISVQPGGMGFVGKPLAFFATEGLEVILPVSSPMSATMELRDGDAIIPWPAGEQLTVRNMNENSSRISYSTGGTTKFEVQREGTYRVKVPSIDGYRPHEDVEVEIAPGPMQTIIVQLARR